MRNRKIDQNLNFVARVEKSISFIFSNFETHVNRYLEPKGSFFVRLVGFPFAKLFFFFNQRMGLKGETGTILAIFKH